MSVLSYLAADHLTPILVAAIIGVLSLLLYVTEIVVLLANRKKLFDSSFFYLFTVRACINGANYINSYIYMRFGLLDLFLPLYLEMGTGALAVNRFFY